MSSLWVEATDAASSRVYYYNKETKQTQWTRPADMEESKTEPAEEEAANWAESTDSKSGRLYYYNRVTKKTSWSKPRCLLQQLQPDSEATVSISYSPASARPSVAGTAAVIVPAVSRADSRSPPPLPSSASNPSSPPRSGTVSPRVAAPQRFVSPAPSPPVQWSEAKDPSSGRSYWYNRDTRETSWTNPAQTLMVLNPLSASAGAAAAAAGLSGSGSPRAFASGTNGTMTAEMLQAMKRMQVGRAGGAEDDEDGKQSASSPTSVPPPPQPPAQSERKDLHSLLDMDDDPCTSEDDSAASSAASSPLTTLSEADASMLAANAVRLRLEGDSGSGGSNLTDLQFSKHRHGWFKRTFRVGQVQSADRLLQFKKSLIKKSLLKANRHLDAIACQLFKNLMSYMGDRKSSKGCKEHCKKMLRITLSAPTGIRDEVYVQLMKQTSGNPRRESEQRGWELILHCLHFFPPSRLILDSVRDYLEKTILKHGNNAGLDCPPAVLQLRRDQHSVLTLAQLCLLTLPAVVASGPRLNVPSDYELTCLVDFSPIYMRLLTCHDGFFHTFKLSSFTRVKDLVQEMTARLDLGSGGELMGLYESQAPDASIFTTDEAETRKAPRLENCIADPHFFSSRRLNDERLCEDERRVLDVLSSWENEPLQQEMTADELNASDSLYSSAFIKKDDRLYKKNKKELHHLNLDELLVEKSDRQRSTADHPNVLRLKFKVVLKISEPALSHDKQAVSLLYWQVYRDTLVERYPLQDKDVGTLAALWLQATYGNYTPAKCTTAWLAELREQLLPWSFLPSTTNPQQAESVYQGIIAKYSKLGNFSGYESMLSYLDYSQANVYYGVCLFLVEQRQFQEHPNILMLGVNCEAVSLMHPGLHFDKELLGEDAHVKRDRERERKEQRMRVLESYQYSDIVTWGNSDDKFILVIGNIIQQRKLIFKTKEGKVMNSLIHEYVKKKVQNRDRAASK